MTQPEVVQTVEEGYVYTQTQDWFSFNIDTWRTLFPLVQSGNPRILEIGTWEGRSAVFLLTELCTKGGSIICIDHFDLMKTTAGRERYAKVTHNLALTAKPFRIIDEFSFPALMTLLGEEITAASTGFDWIYVDGSHEADDTFLDGELVWRLAKKGAIVIFDDYLWNQEPDDSIHHPKRGIDAFMTLHAGEFQLLSSPTQYQIVLQKTSDMRIGFLLKMNAAPLSDDALGYGMYIAMVADTSYGIAAAVAIRSTVAHTKGRVTFYILDLGLTDQDREGLRGSVNDKTDATILFIQLSEDSIAAEGRKTWAKMDLVTALPVERVLYLDADVLVRSDLRELWNVDLEGKSIAAAPDVGFPMGHDGTRRVSYFNAGVLLMNLTKIRERVDILKSVAKRMQDSKFQDQDALNAHFEGDWLPLSLKWNAQGLGTYANHPSADRLAINLSAMADPSVVHFTGPVHPRMEEILNPYVQPYTAKPWGYAGAPGHPYREEWWDVVAKTAWRDFRTSDEYRASCALEKQKVIRVGCQLFEQCTQ